MAAYASTTTYVMKYPEKIGAGQGLAVIAGRCNITNYNQTLAEITAITGKFKSILAVIAGATDTGYLLEWVPASKAFKAWTFEDTGNVPVQVASDIDIGEAYFVAIGLA